MADVLAATDVAADADLIKKLLNEEFSDIIVCADGEHLADDFDAHRPTILIMAFDTLEKCERYYLGLYRRSKIVHAHPHWTIVLGSKEDLQRIFELCKRQYFNDYVLFWPMTHDTARLAMAVHHGFSRVAMGDGNFPTANDVVAQARPLLDLDSRLDQVTATARERIQEVSHRLRQNNDDVAAALQPLDDWANALDEELAPQLQAAAQLRTIAEQVRPTVLVVDDNEFDRPVLLQLLANMGLRWSSAHNGVEALALVRKKRPDLIIMDVNLPDINGVEITRQLKRIELFATIPVVMITGQSERSLVIESLQAGASDFIVKPFDEAVLHTKIAALLHLTG